jgi:hypothetical protein
MSAPNLDAPRLEGYALPRFQIPAGPERLARPARPSMFFDAVGRGARILSRDSRHFDPMGYNQGAVWPFVTGLAAFADLERSRADSGYEKIRAVADLTFAEALGRTPEVLSGARARSLDASVPHQMFSSMSVVGPVFRGVLGIRPRALEGALELTPCFPTGWQEAEISNVEFAFGRLRVVLRRKGDTYSADVEWAHPGGVPPPRVELRPRNGKAGDVQVKARP